MEPQKSRINRDVSHIEKKVISGMEFMSVQDEEYREYSVPVKTPDGTVQIINVKIYNPQWLFVRPSGTHMVLDNERRMYYVPPFASLYWVNKEDKTPANF